MDSASTVLLLVVLLLELRARMTPTACSFNWRSGLFAYLSYRDPNLRATLDIYDGAAQFLREAPWIGGAGM